MEVLYLDGGNCIGVHWRGAWRTARLGADMKSNLHLRVGTAKENIRDCMAKGRDRRGSFSSGEKHPHMKLTDQQVSEIRARKGGRGLGSALAREFGVGPSVISDIRRNKVRT